MLILIGYLAVLASVFGGYALAGGHLAALFQPVELLMIGGAATGAFICSNSGKVLKATLKELGRAFLPSKYNKVAYAQLLSVLYSLLVKIHHQGSISLEADLENPQESPIFAAYPKILANHHVVEFICDYFRMIINEDLSVHHVENLMDNEIETHHHEALMPSHAVAKLADGMPAFGIVAAVMGVVHTMESISLPPAELGMLIAAALVGTFLGILLGYGFIGPLAVIMEQRANESTQMFQCIKLVILAQMHKCSNQTAIEFGRKILFSTERPSAKQLDEMLEEVKKATRGNASAST
ncbi:flagellar motor stator protein MotA [Candidatus Berkiella cookevillensis]|uniref:Flagellar motor stator protein MotA n=1 Tax=Candidatus Berkiella cookevillensis TaxID=437022 RepID=A0A0Q9YPF3_9GAMM|nr:flagellar motor stator protein MotA [Candidatus Berkiella cookevillensis]MCS5709495.1 flagellar motor stator protein MotA [Candidatus Berkiella cookevillensis]